MKFFGANWQTTVSMLGGVLMGFITWLASMSYDQGGISLIVPLQYKPLVTKIAAISALILLSWNAIQQKTKSVTGGSTQQTLAGAVAKQGTQTLVDQTVKASVASGEMVSSDIQKKASS